MTYVTGLINGTAWNSNWVNGAYFAKIWVPA